MLIVDKDNAIHLTRGDTARLILESAMNTVTNEEYVFTSDDILTLTIKKSVSDIEPAVQITIPGGEVLHIKPTDTKPLSFGKYLYDVQLTTKAGDIYTIIGPVLFEITKEVT